MGFFYGVVYTLFKKLAISYSVLRSLTRVWRMPISYSWSATPLSLVSYTIYFINDWIASNGTGNNSCCIINVSLDVNGTAPTISENRILISLLMKWDLLQYITVWNVCMRLPKPKGIDIKTICHTSHHPPALPMQAWGYLHYFWKYLI